MSAQYYASQYKSNGLGSKVLEATPHPAAPLQGVTDEVAAGATSASTPALPPAPAGLRTDQAAALDGVGWEPALVSEAQQLLRSGQADVWDVLTRRFESRLIRTALQATHGRRMEAAQRLGIGRNTITRKIQELGLDAHDDE